MSKNNHIKIGLFGFGVVGEGIYQVLKNTPSLNAEIVKICIKNPDKKRNAPAELFTTSADEILSDNNINVVVELIDDAEAAYTIVTTALRNKKATVSANKKLIATHLQELIDLQKAFNVPFLYEAAVCGSIPVIRNLEEYFDNDLLHSFSGIVNGSTNFILTKLNDEGKTYKEALKEAQVLGFAESNPALDVNGIDAVNKLTIVLNHAYGIITSPDTILHKGITHIHPDDARYAKEKGLRIKLVAQAQVVGNGKVAAWVLPTFIGKDNPLYSVKNEYNGVLIGSSFADTQFLSGKGAGRFPTSSAVLSDISALRYGYRYEYRKLNSPVNYHLSSQTLFRVYVSFDEWDVINKNDFVFIEEFYNSRGRKHLTGLIELNRLVNAGWASYPSVSVILKDNLNNYVPARSESADYRIVEFLN